LIEWDDEIPEWSVLAAEAEKARAMRDEVTGATRDGARPRAVPRHGTADAEAWSTSHGGPRELAARESSTLGEAVAE
jgi:hypothetical protein